MAEEIDLEKCNFRNVRRPVTLTLTLNRVIRHTVVRHSSTSVYKPNFIEIGKKLFVDGRKYGRKKVPTGGRTFPPLILLSQLGEVYLKPRLHDTTGCKTGLTTVLTTGCIV